MKRTGILTFFLLCTSMTHAVTYLYLNNTNSHMVTSVPAKIVLTCDTDSPGNSLDLEVFVDMNGNAFVDTFDERVYFLKLVDGLGWIYDGEMTENGIPGDETDQDGYIRTSLTFDEHLRAYSSQTWLVRVTDQNNTSVTSQLNWDVAVLSPRVSGKARDKETGELLSNVLVQFRDADFPEISRMAITDTSGSYSIQLTPGNWQVITRHSTNKEYKHTTHSILSISEKQSANLDINMEKYKSFVEGYVHFENNSAVENVTVALQNISTMEIHDIRTNEDGYFKAGLEPGKYILTTSQYFSRYLGNHYWPDGFYAQPAIDTVIIKTGASFSKDIAFRPYSTFIRGRCENDQGPMADVLVQGFVTDPKTSDKKLFQTFSKADGSYSLGIDAQTSISVIAQKEGYTPTPLTGFTVDVSDFESAKDINFKFIAQSGIMSLGGSVFGENEIPLPNVQVVAFNMWEHSPLGHLITQTDRDGRYFFDITVEGDWQIGVFKKDAQVHPEMYYQYMSPGLKYANLDFVVSDALNKNSDKGRLLMAGFSVLPHEPNPFYKETVIDFVLPKSSHIEVDVLDMAGNELTTLVNHNLSSGFQKVRWDGTDSQGHAIANGVYLCRVKSKEATALLPITLLR